MNEKDQVLREIVARIKKVAQPECIILFGSQVQGTARPDSDFDLLVIKESDEPRYRRSAPLYTALSDVPVEVDVVVYTPDEVSEWDSVREAFITTAVREGKVLYERQNAVELRYDHEFWPGREVAENARDSALIVRKFVTDRLPPEIT
jgi:predicted nucleotidyltransferase